MPKGTFKTLQNMQSTMGMQGIFYMFLSILSHLIFKTLNFTTLNNPTWQVFYEDEGT